MLNCCLQLPCATVSDVLGELAKESQADSMCWVLIFAYSRILYEEDDKGKIKWFSSRNSSNRENPEI